MNNEITKRNAFVALSQLGSKENWCWKLYCTTCGSYHFRISFAELSRGKHPDDSDWIVTTKNNRWQKLPDFRGDDLAGQERVLKIVAAADINEIAKVAKFPDWLGHIGLLFFWCSFLEGTTKILTKGLVPQFCELIKDKDPDLCCRLQKLLEEDRAMPINYLEEIEFALNSNRFGI
jgi:hypothetical protein